MKIIAIDLGKFNSMVCFSDSATNEYRFQLIKTERGFLKTLLAKNPSDLIVMKAHAVSGWASDLCGELKLKRLVCSPQKEAWRWRSVKRKTDQDDALKLARLAAVGQLKATHVPSVSMREYRGMIKYRKKLVGTDNRLKNSIRALFNRRGIAISRGERTWWSGREQIEEHRKPFEECSMDELSRGQLDQLLVQLDQVQSLLKTVEKKLDAMAKADDRITRVMQIPCVGRVTAEAIVTAIDDAKRFKIGRQVAAYAGLVPRQYQSYLSNRLNRITTQERKISNEPKKILAKLPDFIVAKVNRAATVDIEFKTGMLRRSGSTICYAPDSTGTSSKSTMLGTVLFSHSLRRCET